MAPGKEAEHELLDDLLLTDDDLPQLGAELFISVPELLDGFHIVRRQGIG